MYSVVSMKFSNILFIMISFSTYFKIVFLLIQIIQCSGEFIISFPFAYHMEYNHGYNCTETVNFATEHWIDVGKQAILVSTQLFLTL